MMNKIALFLMSQKGYESITRVVGQFGSGLIDFVVLSKDKNVNNDYYSEILEFCKQNQIQTYDKNDSFNLKSKYIIAISWRWLIAADDNSTLITLHDSLLPKYRGFAPLVNQLINREPEVGVTAIVSNDDYDKGEVISQVRMKISYPVKIMDVIGKLSMKYAELLLDVVSKIRDTEDLVTYKQDENEATYSLWRDEEDYRIDWKKSASYILGFINALGDPYKGASAILLNRKIRIFDAMEVEDVDIVNRDVGKVIFMKDGFPVVTCGEGLLKLTKSVYNDTQESIFPLTRFRIRFS